MSNIYLFIFRLLSGNKISIFITVTGGLISVVVSELEAQSLGAKAKVDFTRRLRLREYLRFIYIGRTSVNLCGATYRN